MKNGRNITVVLLFVFLLAIVVQFVRTDSVFKLQKNTGALDESNDVRMVATLSEDEINRRERDRYCIIIDSRDENSIVLKNQFAQVLRHMKKDFEIQDAAYNDAINTDYSAFVICTGELGRIVGIDSIINFAEEGGSVFFAVTPNLDSTFYRIYRKLGIADAGEAASLSGIKLLSDVMLKGKGTVIGEDFILNSSIAVALDNKCILHAASIENVPLMWEVPYGSGRFLVFNGTMLNEKRSRGLLTAALTLLNDTYIYPVLNIQAVFIDDFPAPFPEGNDQNITDRYRRSIKAFFRDVWWPDMLRIRATYGLKFTGMAIMSYDDLVAPPFPDKERFDPQNLLVYGRELLENGGELGMHGYNHQSLVTKGDSREKYARDELKYKIFDNVEDVSASIKSFMEYFKSVYADYAITCYVPPSNVLGDASRQVMKKILPNLETISSIYYNNLEKGSYAQEFELADDGIVEFPRLTYGFIRDELNDWAILNGVNELGVVSHFCHPDDVLDAQRSENKSWDELSEEFEDFIKMTVNKYPWLRSMTMTKAGRDAKRFLSSSMYTDYRENEIDGYINGYPGDYYFILRTNKTAYALRGCEISKLDTGSYLVCAREMKYSVGLKN